MWSAASRAAGRDESNVTATSASALIAALAAALVVALAAPLRPQPRRSPGAAVSSPEVAVSSPETPSTSEVRRTTNLPTIVTRFVATFRRRDRWPPARSVAAWCDDLARELRSGSTLRHALVVVVPDDPATRESTDPLRLAVDRSRPVSAAVAGVRHPGPGAADDHRVRPGHSG